MDVNIERDLEIRKMRDRYRVYIDTHQKNVKRVWANIKTHAPEELYNVVLAKCIELYNGKECDIVTLINVTNIIDSQINAHDNSKYSDEEFEPYRKRFYPVDEKEKEDSAQEFEMAWKHHYENNMHHWNWWAYNKQAEKMPLTFVIEMMIDWIAMSITYPTGTAFEWYKTQEDIVLGLKQKKIVEYFLPKYYKHFNADGTLKNS